MARVVIYLGLSSQLQHHENDVVFGVDRGAYFLAKHHQKMKIAYGDFDSVSVEELLQIKRYASEVIQTTSEKDFTDSEGVLAYCDNYQEIVFIGGLGGRKDHELINLALAYRDQRIVFIDDLNRIQSFTTGTYQIKKDSFHYLSLLPLTAGCLSLKGVKYPLNHREVNDQDLYLTSNEILHGYATLEIHHGKFLVIQSKDK